MRKILFDCICSNCPRIASQLLYYFGFVRVFLVCPSIAAGGYVDCSNESQGLISV